MKQWEFNQPETPVAATNLQLHQREWELKRWGFHQQLVGLQQQQLGFDQQQ